MKYVVWFLGLVVLAAIGVVAYQYAPKVSQNLGEVVGETDTVQIALTRMTETDMEFVYVDRKIPKTNVFEEMVKLTIQELVKGPTALEEAQGLVAAFNPGTEVNYVRLSGNTLTVDFNEAFDFQMGGSARIMSITQSLDRTIRQFPIEGVADIQFTINNGEREAVLEP